MPLSINTNIASLTAQRAMLNTGQELETAFERLSTGKRINTAVDDAAGLAISERLTGRINGLNQLSETLTMASRWFRSPRVHRMKLPLSFSGFVI